jgi:hypothetical protein
MWTGVAWYPVEARGVVPDSLGLGTDRMAWREIRPEPRLVPVRGERVSGEVFDKRTLSHPV